MRALKDLVKKTWHFLFLLFERLGIHVTPVHFYSGLPDVSYLKKHPEEWINRSGLPGIRVDVDEQVRNLVEICLPFQTEYTGLGIYHEAAKENGESGYGEIESQALHGFVRYYRPRRIIQIGCGLATHCVMHAVGLNDTGCEVRCVEPYPNPQLKAARGVNLVQKKVQQLPLDFFANLEKSDFLLIDSTHVSQVGSDVNYLVMEILPRLQPGVIVSFHDIYFPFDYSRGFLDSLFFPLETSLVRAFLINNDRAGIIACMSQLHYDRPGDLKRIFPDYRPQQSHNGLRTDGSEGCHFPSSLWLVISPGLAAAV